MNGGEQSLSVKESEARAAIGRRIVYWALAAVTVLGVVAVLMAGLGSPEKLAGVKDVLGMLLPVIGAWIGTVLAFYFSRENYVAAAQNSATVLGLTLEQRLQSIPVESVMIPIEKAENKFVLRQPAAQVKLKADLLAATVDQTKKNRMLILEPSGVVKYVVHRSMVDKFIAEQALSNKPVADLTLENLAQKPEDESWISAFGTVGREARLNAVKALIDGNPKCSDVLVTEDGSKTARAIGWVTNVIVAEKSKA